MIKSWTLKNFKSVKDLNKLDFAPLTIFAGANSSGKSTILQSILLTAQTLQNSVSTKSIILNGHILKFGAFNDILSNGSNERIIDIGFEAEPMIRSNDPEVTGYPRYFFRRDGEIKNIFCSFSFSDTINGTTTELFQLHPKLEKSTIKAILSNNRIEEVEAVRSNKTIEDRVKELKLNTDEILPTDMQTLEYEVKKPSYFKANPIYYLGRDITSGRYVGAFLSHFLPRILTIVYDEIEQEKESFLNILSNKEQYNNGQKIFDKYINDTIINSLKQLMKEIQDEVQNPSQQRLFEIKNVLTSVERLFNEFNYSNYLRVSRTTIFGRNFFQKVDEKRSEFKLKIKKTEHSDFRLTSTFNYADFCEYIEFIFKRQIKYLGPLRDEPKPVYPLSLSSDPRDIGLKGENTAAVLEVNKNIRIKYIPPLSLSKGYNDVKAEEDTLINAVLNWLDYLGIAKRVDPADKGKLGHELKISPSGTGYLHDLTHVGVGVSQVLPILVLCLLAEKDSTLIFEQPELHLNPKVQTRIADFFFSMTLLKKQCLVETHSEYLINRLRYQVAINPDNDISENIIMYFVEKEEQWSSYKKIKINKYGVVENWPKGFFDENEETAAAILRAAMKKRKQEKSTSQK